MGLIIDEEHFSKLLERLKLNGIRGRLDALLDEAAKEGLSYREVLCRLCCAEAQYKDERRIRMGLSIAHFPNVRTLSMPKENVTLNVQ